MTKLSLRFFSPAHYKQCSERKHSSVLPTCSVEETLAPADHVFLCFVFFNVDGGNFRNKLKFILSLPQNIILQFKSERLGLILCQMNQNTAEMCLICGQTDDLHMCEDTCDTEVYIGILDRLMLLSLKHLFWRSLWIVQQDKVRPHSACAAAALVHRHSVCVLTVQFCF